MTARVPRELRRGPFGMAEARAVGLTWRNLQAHAWRRMSRGQYVWTGLRHDVELRLRAVAQRMPAQYAFSGATAAWIHGLDLAPCEPIEVTVPRDAPVRARAGVRMRRVEVTEHEVTSRRGLRVTSAMRTVCDLGSRPDPVEAVVAIDMALHEELIDSAALGREVDERRGAKGIRRLRRAFALADGRAESPMETRLRVALIVAGLPSPNVQANLHDAAGAFLGRVDLFYEDVSLVIEYDGQNHKKSLAADVKRQNALINSGYHVLRFTAADLLAQGSVAAEVRRARDRLLRHSAIVRTNVGFARQRSCDSPD
jgi:very-short-patch-repair endonuclease